MLIKKLIFDSSNMTIHLIVPVNNQLTTKMADASPHKNVSKSIGISVFYSKVILQIQMK